MSKIQEQAEQIAAADAAIDAASADVTVEKTDTPEQIAVKRARSMKRHVQRAREKGTEYYLDRLKVELLATVMNFLTRKWKGSEKTPAELRRVFTGVDAAAFRDMCEGAVELAAELSGCLLDTQQPILSRGPNRSGIRPDELAAAVIGKMIARASKTGELAELDELLDSIA